MMHVLLSLVFAGLLVQAARTDVIDRRIPNPVVGLILLLWPLRALTLEPTVALIALLVALGVLTVGVVVWMAGWLGAGDAKLLAGVALWAGHEHIVATLLVTVVAGAAIAVALLTLRFWDGLLPNFARSSGGGAAAPITSTTSPSSRASRSVPYGVAIAAGGLWLAGRMIAG